jgi:S1-C subfamily serine protease
MFTDIETPTPVLEDHADDARALLLPSASPQATSAAERTAVDAWPTTTISAPPGLPPDDGTRLGSERPRRRPRTWRYAVALVVLMLALAGGFGLGKVAFGTGRAQPTTTASNLQQMVENVAKAVEPSVVEITSVGQSGEAIGSGDILTANGYIVTNDHVVEGYSTYTVTLANGTRLPAQLIGEDSQDDLAVIKVAATNLRPMAFADSSKVSVGEFAIAIGNPYGQRETATFGTVSATNRTASESPSGPASFLTGLIQSSAPIAPGNSGGALVNLQGQLIGIPTLGEGSQQAGPGTAGSTTIGFAIPSNRVKTVAQELIRTGHVTSTGQGFLGIQGQDVTPDVAAANGLTVQSGVLVAGFADDTAGQSPAQQAGLQAGDVITAVNGQSVGDSSDLAGAVATQAPGKHVTLTVERSSRQLTITLTLGERPTNS